MSNKIPTPVASPFAENYRREALSLRTAAELVRDKGLSDQLLWIAEQYEAAAASSEPTLGRKLQTTLDLDLPEAAD
jgi:hypothetical protein